PIYGRQSFRTIREQAFDRLADHVKRHVCIEEIEEKMYMFQRSIPVRSFSGDLIKKSPLGMMQGCQPHHSPYQGGLQMNCTQ
ncbi:hypothetical protein ETC01_18390, partial [Geobacillus sp. NFOSA3]|nr:hypothetical protein [Geobacillus sp. NFOSA3]